MFAWTTDCTSLLSDGARALPFEFYKWSPGVTSGLQWTRGLEVGLSCLGSPLFSREHSVQSGGPARQGTNSCVFEKEDKPVCCRKGLLFPGSAGGQLLRLLWLALKRELRSEC